MKPLLVLVDFQEDFLSSPSLQPCAARLVRMTGRWLNFCRKQGIAVAHVRTAVREDLSDAMAHWRREGVLRCVPGSAGHACPVALAAFPGERVFFKAAFSPYVEGAFQEWVAQEGYDTLVLSGLHLHACVRQLALDAYQRGLQVVLAVDALGSDDPIHAAATLRYLRDRNLHTVRLEAFAQGLPHQPERPLDAWKAELNAAIGRAKAQQVPWRQSPWQQRLARLAALPGLLRRDADRLAMQIVGETSKPLRFARMEIEQSACMAGQILDLAGRLFEDDGAGSVRLRYCPHGLVAVMTPYNNPLYLPLGKLLPALLYGNAVVWKAAPEAGMTAQALRSLLLEAGLPGDLIVLAEGGIPEASALMAHVGVDALTLTGSLEAGHAALEACGRRQIPLQAELGGNNAAVVWQDADLDAAASEVLSGAFDLAGQRCTANRRVILHRGCKDAFLRLLFEKAPALRWGDALDPETRIGPLVSASRATAFQELIEAAISAGAGATYPWGRHPPGPEGNWAVPVVLQVLEAHAEVVQEESFGPLLVVQVADDWDGAMRLCNGVRQGLAAAFFSKDTVLQLRFLDEAKAGILKINQSTAGAVTGVAFGGWKASGVGPPEHGVFDRDFFTRVQTLYASDAGGGQGGKDCNDRR
jgi:acyl-CoA reductase-like NAD-dependent aldehyde dehydrogenase/nicotinamidase-related amidase